jgi:hypothetical protein
VVLRPRLSTGLPLSARVDLTKAIFYRNPDNPPKIAKQLLLIANCTDMHFHAVPKRAVPHQDLRANSRIWKTGNLENLD